MNLDYQPKAGAFPGSTGLSGIRGAPGFLSGQQSWLGQDFPDQSFKKVFFFFQNSFCNRWFSAKSVW